MDGLPVVSVPSTAPVTSSITRNGEMLAKFDSDLGHWILTKPIHALVGKAPSANPQEYEPSAFELDDSPSLEKQPLLVAKNDSAPSSSKAEMSQATNIPETSQSFDQRPSNVYVDTPARIERNTNDPAYRLAGRVYQATATIAKTAANRYWMAWRADNTNAKEGPGNFAVLAYSDDAGKSAKEYGYLTYSPDHPGNQIVDPMLWKDPSGRLWLFYGVVGDDKRYDGVGGSWAVILDDPDAKNPVWGEPFRLSYYGVPRRPIAVNNKWYIAVDGWRFSAEEPPQYMQHVGPHIYELNWHDRKMEHITQLPPNNKGQYSGFFETEFVQKEDGNVLALLRSYGGSSQMQYSTSSPDMRSWTAWQDYNVAEPNSSSRSWLGRTPSGKMLLCWNNDLVRKSLTIGLSDDDGATYKYRRLLEPDSSLQVSYPVVAFGDKGEILVIYDNGRETQRQIRIAKINENQIIYGTGSPEVNVISDPARAK
ncbi:sialidase family protein [Pseudomonas sp.]|uniref:sialidase family protein n=1 Tax=Pseudomonas sp. TaxID=306 RepID=UPI0028AB6BB2|nr:sialidase family protein [Pseudomonas sp.]